MIEIRELTKMYGKQYALNHLSLTIPEGQIFGFLGHNGAGKSKIGRASCRERV